MSDQKHIIRQKVFHYGYWKWICLLVAILLLFCFFLKCCSPNLINGDGSTNQNPIPFPNESEARPPIDEGEIIQNPDDPLERDIVGNRLNIYLQDTTDAKTFATQLVNDRPDDSIKVIDFASAYNRIQIELLATSREAVKEVLKDNYPGVKYVLEEWVLKQHSVKMNDPYFSNAQYTWYYDAMGVYDAWAQTQGDPSITIAVIDDGFDLQHPELQGNFSSQWNVIDNSSDVNTGNNTMVHGTHVAGSAVGKANNKFGLSGIAPGCKLMPIQIGNPNGLISLSAIVDAVFYALLNDARIINLSLGLSAQGLSTKMTPREQKTFAKTQLLDEQQLWEDIFSIAEKEGTIIVQAAGNDAILAEVDPMKRCKKTIVVGASMPDNKQAPFSNHGDAVTIYAPGVKIMSALPGKQSGLMDGTSMASPMVAGCIGLLLSRNNNLRFDDLRKIILQTGTNMNQSNGKIIQIGKAIQSNIL